MHVQLIVYKGSFNILWVINSDKHAITKFMVGVDFQPCDIYLHGWID